MKSCHAAAESDKIPAEIRPKTFDSPGCSLKFHKGGDATCPDRVMSQRQTGTSNAAPTVQAAGVAKLPDPWLFDSAALIREIDRIRETALQIPTNGDCNATHFGIQATINALWTLRENLRYLLALHSDGQRRFRKRDSEHQTIYDLCTWLRVSCA